MKGSTMTPIRVLALSIPCGWLLTLLLVFLVFPWVEDTTIGFDAPHLTGRLTFTK